MGKRKLGDKNPRNSGFGERQRTTHRASARAVGLTDERKRAIPHHFPQKKRLSRRFFMGANFFLNNMFNPLRLDGFGDFQPAKHSQHHGLRKALCSL